MRIINQNEFRELADNKDSIILDVRRPDECARGIVPNAKLINFMDQRRFSSEIEGLDKEKHYLVYCRSGNRSGMACRMMESLGFGNTYNLQGGMMVWNGNVE